MSIKDKMAAILDGATCLLKQPYQQTLKELKQLNLSI